MPKIMKNSPKVRTKVRKNIVADPAHFEVNRDRGSFKPYGRRGARRTGSCNTQLLAFKFMKDLVI